MALQRAAIALVLLAALLGPAWGQDEEMVEVLVRTEPPGATVILEKGVEVTGARTAGRPPEATGSGSPAPLPSVSPGGGFEPQTLKNPSGQVNYIRERLLKPRRQVVFRLQMDGYETRTWPVSTDYLKPGKVRAIPPEAEPPISLRPTTANWLKPLLGASGALLLLVGGAFAAFSRSARRRLQAAEDAETRVGRMVVGSASEDPLLGKRLGSYWIVERLGVGGMGVVYRAVRDHELQSGRPLDEIEGVAVKVLSEDAAGDEEFLERFRREVQISTSMVHPHIVRLDDYGEHLGRGYLVMELIRGESLRSRVRDGGLPAAEALALLRPIAEALSFAHARGVVHRDLKPENIMIASPGERVVVMDFGLARGSDYPTVTRTSALVGTPAYMAPEQITKGVVGPSIDQYALGVIAYELLCGRLPFDGSDPVQLIFRHLSDEPPPLHEYAPGVRPAVEAVVARMLAKEPEKRYRDLAEALEALEEAAR